MSTRTACGTRLRRGFHGGYGAVALKRVCTMANMRKRILLRVMAAMALVTFALPAAAQTPYIPYFGKNQIRHDKFEWYRYAQHTRRAIRRQHRRDRPRFRAVLGLRPRRHGHRIRVVHPRGQRRRPV